MNKIYLEKLFEDEMIASYKKAGKDTGYWGRYFLRSIKNNGGLETARRMLGKKLTNPSEKKGFQALIEAGRLDLSLESLVLQSRFKNLFTMNELAEAQRRLDFIPAKAKRRSVPPEQNFPESLEIEGLSSSVPELPCHVAHKQSATGN